MSVDAAMLTEFAKFEASLQPDHDVSHLAPLETTAAIFGWIIASARAEGGSHEDEADQAELLARISDMSPAKVRQVAGTLGALGYRAVADRLRSIAGRRQKTLAPLA
jgi:hypothetical protein